MTDQERRIQSCIDHINTAVDVDPWAKELVAEMGKEILKAQLSKEDTTSDCISRQEAIRIASGYCHFTNVAKELEKLPSVQPVDKDINVSCKDAISRQAVIDICNNVIDLWEGQLGEGALVAIKNAINNLPSAQPDIIRCRDCKHYYFADNRIPQERRYTCELYGDRWQPDDYCSSAERRTDGEIIPE